MNRFISFYTTTTALIVTIFTTIFGTYWYIFAGYLFFNVLDWLTGWYKARYAKKESSIVGLRGIVKKTGYWVIILVAFLVPKLFISLGRDVLGVDLDFLLLLGWFTLATLLANEIRSVLENLVECGYHVPEFLVRGLAVTDQLIHAQSGKADKNK